MSRRLNFGCGTDIRAGWINLDIVALPGVDVVHDVRSGPLPFPDESFDEICAKDVLEHFDDVGVVREFHRLLRPGGVLSLQVPHFTSKDACADPTHRRFFAVGSFGYFLAAHPRNYYFGYAFARIATLRIRFDRRALYPWNYLLEPLVNLNSRSQNVYEGTPLRVFPATNIEVTFVK